MQLLTGYLNRAYYAVQHTILAQNKPRSNQNCSSCVVVILSTGIWFYLEATGKTMRALDKELCNRILTGLEQKYDLLFISNTFVGEGRMQTFQSRIV